LNQSGDIFANRRWHTPRLCRILVRKLNRQFAVAQATDVLAQLRFVLGENFDCPRSA